MSDHSKIEWTEATWESRARMSEDQPRL